MNMPRDRVEKLLTWGGACAAMAFVVAGGVPRSILAGLDVAAGALLVVVGIVAVQRSPRYAAVVTGTGLVWLASDVWPLLALVHRPLLALCALSFPEGRTRSWRSLALVAASGCALLVTVQPWSDAVWLAIGCALAVVAGLDRGREPDAATTVRTRASLQVAVVLAAPSVVRLLAPGWQPGSVILAVYSALVALLATTLLVGAAELRGRETDAVIELTGVGSTATLQALRDEQGRPGVAAASSRTAAIALLEEHEQSQQGLRETIHEVRVSQQRLVDSEARERHRLQRRLDVGAFRLLDDLSEQLQECVRLGGDATAVAARRCLDEVDRTRADLRLFAAGLQPLALRDQGLGAALEELARDSPVAFTVTTPAGRLPPEVESTVWYVCAEAVANAGKHALAESGRIEVSTAASEVVARVRDDGVGGAQSREGGGLGGLEARVSAAGGVMRVESPAGGGTEVEVRLPCG